MAKAFLKKAFLDKVIREGIVDTRNYRYVCKGNIIKRLPIKYLDTTTAIDSWETVGIHIR